MDNYIKTWLFDIIKSIEEIDSYFPASKKIDIYANGIRTNIRR